MDIKNESDFKMLNSHTTVDYNDRVDKEILKAIALFVF